MIKRHRKIKKKCVVGLSLWTSLSHVKKKKNKWLFYFASKTFDAESLLTLFFPLFFFIFTFDFWPVLFIACLANLFKDIQRRHTHSSSSSSFFRQVDRWLPIVFFFKTIYLPFSFFFVVKCRWLHVCTIHLCIPVGVVHVW